MKKLSLILIAILILGFNIKAQQTIQDDEKRGHHKGDGLFFSASLGASYLSINDDITGSTSDNMKMTGTGIAIDIKLGAVIKENFILHGDIISTTSFSLKILVDGEPLGTISGDNSVSIIMFGGGGTYYFYPGVYFSGTLGMGGFSITAGENTTNTQKGLGINLKLGKEWWVSKNWDLGGSIGFNYTNVNNKVGDITEKLSGVSIGLMFTATFN
ncbi:MAG: autotransporter domain-containing protein [Bacteroidota bacterium]|nr:autotransporter domain-containing protein [Bacteroidota bacterium]